MQSREDLSIEAHDDAGVMGRSHDATNELDGCALMQFRSLLDEETGCVS